MGERSAGPVGRRHRPVATPRGVTPPSGPPTTASPASASATRVLVLTAIAAIAAGLVIAGLLLFATGRSGGAPKGPFALGSVAGLRDEVKQSPVYIADPTGGAGLWLALRDNEIVALSAVAPGNSSSCTVRWRGSVNAYEDCKGARYQAKDLATFPLRRKAGILFVDTRRAIVPPG